MSNPKGLPYGDGWYKNVSRDKKGDPAPLDVGFSVIKPDASRFFTARERYKGLRPFQAALDNGRLLGPFGTREEADGSAGPAAAEPMVIPTLEEVMERGYTKRAAVGMIAGMQAEKDGKSVDECNAAAEAAMAEVDAEEEAAAKAKAKEEAAAKKAKEEADEKVKAEAEAKVAKEEAATKPDPAADGGLFDDADSLFDDEVTTPDPKKPKKGKRNR